MCAERNQLHCVLLFLPGTSAGGLLLSLTLLWDKTPEKLPQFFLMLLSSVSLPDSESRGKRSQGPRLSFLKDAAVDPWANAQKGNAS